MYKFIFSILNIFIVMSVFSNYSYSKNIKHVIFFDYRNEATVSLNLGADSIATDYYDKTLGEQDIPPLPPPDAVIPVFEILDTTINEIKYSQIEYKNLEKGIFNKTFLVRLLGNAQEDFKLSIKGLPEGVDSIIIKDKINGSIFRWVVKENTPKDTLMLRFYSQFAIDVFYNSDKITSVENDLIYWENNQIEYLNCKINISDNKVQLLNNQIKIIEIYDILGNIVLLNENLQFEQNIKNKVVFIHIEYNNKRHLVKKIL